jgi:hypothetical protein
MGHHLDKWYNQSAQNPDVFGDGNRSVLEEYTEFSAVCVVS